MSTLPRIAFVHVPKCGGQSIQQRLAEYYGEASCLRVGRARFGGDIEVSQGPGEWKQALARARVVYGHYSWPFLEGMARQTDSPPFTPVAVVREPLARAVSEYWYIRRTREHPLWKLCQEIPISEYLLGHHDHGCQSQFLGGSRVFGEVLERLEREYEAVCPLDEIDHFARLLARALGHPPRPAPEVNRSARAGEQRTVGPRTASRFYEKNISDLKLYWWVVENWQAHWRLGGRVAELEAEDAPA